MNNRINGLLTNISNIGQKVDLKHKGVSSEVYLHDSRYYFSYVEVSKGDSLISTVEDVRKQIKKNAKAFWLFNEVGLYILIKVDRFEDFKDVESITVDKTGFHAVILQVVHIVDINGKEKLYQSNWFGRKFGKSLE